MIDFIKYLWEDTCFPLIFYFNLGLLGWLLLYNIVDKATKHK